MVSIAPAPSGPTPTAIPAARPSLPAAVIAPSFQSATVAVAPRTRQVLAAVMPDRSVSGVASATATPMSGASEVDSTETTTQPPVPEAGSRSLDSLLDQALNGKVPIGAPSNAGTDSSLPPLPAREDVARALAALQTRIDFCADGRPGIATAHVTATSDGRISDVRVSGGPAARLDAARCMERVIRQVQFPRFKQPSFRITYPFQI